MTKQPSTCQLCNLDYPAVQWVIHDGQRIKICENCMDIIIDDHIIGAEDE